MIVKMIDRRLILDLKDMLYKRNPMLILSYLSKINGSSYGRKISEDLGINQGSVSVILKDFEATGLVKCENIGKTILYYVDKDNPIIKKFRLFENLLELNSLVDKIKEFSREIILFGSCAKGEDAINSDIDLFIVADKDNHQIIREMIGSYEIDREINPVLIDTLELMEMENYDKVFLNEVYSGIKLWEGGNDFSGKVY